MSRTMRAWRPVQISQSCDMGFVQDSGAEVIVEVVAKVSASINVSKL